MREKDIRPDALFSRYLELVERILADDELRERFSRYSLEKMRREFDDRLVVRQGLFELLRVPDEARCEVRPNR
jgi:hypothetical protein